MSEILEAITYAEMLSNIKDAVGWALPIGFSVLSVTIAPKILVRVIRMFV